MIRKTILLGVVGKLGGNILVQDIYSYITQDLRTAHCEAWLADMWRWEAPLKPLLS